MSNPIEKKEEFKKWITERDKAISTLDIKEFKKFYNKWKKKGLYQSEFPGDEVLEIAIRKMACNITSIPEEVKKEAEEWLTERGFSKEFK